MLRSPRRLPSRFNRDISPSTRRLVRKRHRAPFAYSFERWSRVGKRLKRRFFSWKGSLVRLLLIALVSLVPVILILVTFSPLFRVQEVRVLRTDLRLDLEHIQSAMAPLFGRHILSVSDEEVEMLLESPLPDTQRAAVPDLSQLAVRRRYPNALSLEIKLDPIIARLRIEEPEASAASASGNTLVRDYLTSKGMYVAYSSVQAGSGLSLPLITLVDWGSRPEPWKEVIGENLLQALREAEKAIAEQFGHGIRERRVYLRAQEFHLHTPTYALWLDLKSPLQDHLKRYRLFLKTVGTGVAKEYVDLRLRERVVYK